jgi:phosphatidylinositol alpha 1,6-mannosyltransferase
MLTLRRPFNGPMRQSKSTLRVAIVAESFLPAVNGVTNSVLRVIEHLRSEGHEAMVIAPGPGGDRVDGTRVHRVRAVDLPRYDALRVGLPVVRLKAILREFRPDVVHLAAPSVLGAAAARAASDLQLPLVAVYQTDLAGFARRHGLGVAARPLWAWIRWIHQHADVTLAPSTASVWQLRAHGVTEVRRWARGVDLVRFHPEHRNPDLRSQLAPNGEVLVGYVGRLAKEKQVERLAPISRLPGVRLVVVGDGPERVALQRVMPAAHFAGFCCGQTLSQLHASFDVFVHPGLDETFCQAVQEALASGVPVVAPAAGGPIDLVTHGVNGFLWSPEQPEMLLGAVQHLVETPSLRAEMGVAARAGVIDRPWSAVMAELIDHYRHVIGIRSEQPTTLGRRVLEVMR